MGTEWIKDFFTQNKNLTARFYRLSSQPKDVYDLMYDKCQANITIILNRQNGGVKIGNIYLSLRDKKYWGYFCLKVKEEYFIPKYITEFILNYLYKEWKNNV